jgi:putative ATPase
MLILSVKIGNANPTAFIMANNTFQAVTTMDILKAEYLKPMCHLSRYLSKSNASYLYWHSTAISETINR